MVISVSAFNERYPTPYTNHLTPSDLRLPTQITAGGAIAADGDGGLEVADAAGEVVGAFADPVMWDSNPDVPGEQGVVEPVELVVDPEAAQEAGVPAAVDVVADGEWLTDPERVFPVVVDPTYAIDYSYRKVRQRWSRRR